MTVSRYQRDSIIGEPQRLATAAATLRIRQAISAGTIATREITLTEGQRLDTLAGQLYGDGQLWWGLAAASGIGWWLQAPPGTRILAPTDIDAVMRLV
jgi:hypothetical protein